MIQDPAGRQSTFDGENKQTEVKDALNNLVGRYFYDGNGRRVKKMTASEITIFVYDGMGKLAAEYSTAPPVSAPTTSYTATDPLGSPRVITNKLGEIVSRRDFMPFGEQLAPDATYRTESLKYKNSDDLRQKFTGYQRDEETGLDFAEARYYNNQHGRFTAVDPLLASGKSTDPQTFNRYVYTMNRPLILTDSTGLQAGKPQNEEPIKVNTQLSKKAPTITKVSVTSNGKPIKDDLLVGDQFTITYTYRINKPDDGQDPTKAGRIESVVKDRTVEFENGKPKTTETEPSSNGSFSEVEGTRRTGEPVVESVGERDDEVEVTKSETFEVIGNSEMTRGGTGQINFQIVVTDPRAPITDGGNSSDGNGRGSNTPRNPAVFTTRPTDPRPGVKKDPDKAISFRNRRRSQDE